MEFIIIDDSVFDLFTQEKLLLKSGLTTTVRPFSSPNEAIAYLKRHGWDLPETVILLDLQMPEINGFEFAAQYGKLPGSIRSKIKLFMISSTVDEADIEEAKNNPYIIQLLSKPLEIPVLRALLAK
jgi:CheY-like chemotaxis protein